MHYVVSIQVQKVAHRPVAGDSFSTRNATTSTERTITELAKVTVREAEFSEAIRKAQAHLELAGDTVSDDTQGEGKVYRER